MPPRNEPPGSFFDCHGQPGVVRLFLIINFIGEIQWLLNAPFPLSSRMPSLRTSSVKSTRSFENAGLRLVAAQMRQLSQAEAEGFYAVHKERPFFKDLVAFMTSGPVMIQVLEGEGAIAKNRELMGATDPKKAAPGTDPR